MATTLTDATGVEVSLERSPRAVVSLVPSFTEMVCALRLGSRLVGITRFCVEPAAEVTPIRKIGGTKNPDIEQIVRLDPELVLANKEENREEDVTALRDAGLTVYVGEVRRVDESAAELERVAKLLGGVALKITQSMEAALEEQRHLERLRPRVRAACLIWRRPYMAAGGDTYIGDLLRVCGGINVFEHVGADGRYPRVGLRELIEADPEVGAATERAVPIPRASRSRAGIAATVDRRPRGPDLSVRRAGVDLVGRPQRRGRRTRGGVARSSASGLALACG